MRLEHIDHGNAFDWGRASADYALYRDIYPETFYRQLMAAGVAVPGQRVLDIGTGTGVLPRHLAPLGVSFVGTDISENQIAAARALSQSAGLDISYRVCPAEQLDFPDESFDAVTACQCFLYFDKALLLPNLARMLKKDGRLAILYMNWLPFEDEIAAQSEALVLKYSPHWTGAGFKRSVLAPPPWAEPFFETERYEAFDLEVPFTRESWNGRIRASRGISASLSQETVKAFEEEHLALLERTAPPRFTILHEATILILRKK